MEDFSGKTAVITGGATGIGRALAHRLAAEGMNIVIASTNRARLDDAAASIRAAGGEVTAVVCDVADRKAVNELAARSRDAYGQVHLLCANAGVTTSGLFLDHHPGDWDWVFDVVLKGVANCIQSFYPAMAEAGEGHILITGSQAGLVPDWAAQHGPYTAAKSAAMALGPALRPEAAAHNVGVSVLIPAGTESDILQSSRSRPERYGPATQGEISVRGDIPRYLSADDVAVQAVEGIRRNAAFIATHPEMKPLVAEYFDRILSAYDRP